MDDARRFCRIIHRDHGEIIAAVAFCPVLRALVGVKRSDVPRTDAEDVGHFREAVAWSGLIAQIAAPTTAG